MMLAFKNGAIAAQHENPLSALFSKSIILATGGLYSHVEVVLTGSLNAATCFAAVEPVGCRYAVIDLTQPVGMWAILEIPTTQSQDDFIRGFCAGSNQKPYDSLGIVGIGADDGLHDPHDRFCSEFACELCAAVFPAFVPKFKRWMVAPSCAQGDTKRGDLFAMLTAFGARRVQ